MCMYFQHSSCEKFSLSIRRIVSYSSTVITTHASSAPPQEGINSDTFGRQHTFRHFLGLGISSSSFSHKQSYRCAQSASPFLIIQLIVINGICHLYHSYRHMSITYLFISTSISLETNSSDNGCNPPMAIFLFRQNPLHNLSQQQSSSSRSRIMYRIFSL